MLKEGGSQKVAYDQVGEFKLLDFDYVEVDMREAIIRSGLVVNEFSYKTNLCLDKKQTFNMVLISAAICSKGGKTLVSRQFV
ncbi:unnamed protein product, partial [Allacma fusca]